jgi:HSP20 family molecular chaperone IbpA
MTNMLGITKSKNDAARKADDKTFASPAVDVYENDNEFLVLADLPGVPQDGAEVTLERDRLVLQAPAPGRNYRREFAVPPSVDAEAVSASLKAGVLTVHLPKRAPYKPRQIAVRTA